LRRSEIAIQIQENMLSKYQWRMHTQCDYTSFHSWANTK